MDSFIRKNAWLLWVSALAAGTVYIMANELGLVAELDFGAGAYYYADIPGFEKFVFADAYDNTVPMWLLILLFLIWGGIMYRFWGWVEKRCSQERA